MKCQVKGLIARNGRRAFDGTSPLVSSRGIRLLRFRGGTWRPDCLLQSHEEAGERSSTDPGDPPVCPRDLGPVTAPGGTTFMGVRPQRCSSGRCSEMTFRKVPGLELGAGSHHAGRGGRRLPGGHGYWPANYPNRVAVAHPRVQQVWAHSRRHCWQGPAPWMTPTSSSARSAHVSTHLRCRA
jgi:hypothetical protein